MDEKYKLMIGAVVILIIALTIFLIVYFQNKNKNKNNDGKNIGNKGNWTDEQINNIVNKIYNDSDTPDYIKIPEGKQIITCIVKYLANLYTYSDASQDNVILQSDYLDSIHKCFGTKGDWSAAFKEIMKKTFATKNVSPDCINCVINKMNDQLDPVDLMNTGTQSSLERIMTDIIKNCPSCPQSN